MWTLARCFSALQRAENSSIGVAARRAVRATAVSVLFSEPKIPQSRAPATERRVHRGFSALQRAENSSMIKRSGCRRWRWMFQCSSASRKFLNYTVTEIIAEELGVSVLFSEPKIPQCHHRRDRGGDGGRFSALQRAENSSISILSPTSEKPSRVSVLFSEPKIPQFIRQPECGLFVKFQCSSASRKFLNRVSRASGAAEPASFSALQRAENSSMRRAGVQR